METIKNPILEFSIVNGPSKWDLIILALGEGQEVCFESVSGQKFFAKVSGVDEAGPLRQTWTVQGYCRREETGPSYPYPYEVWFRTDKRTGHLKLGRRI